jgi:EAL domain-containing protein (putative c-di-GMP-specific phosphodiesterase class I)
MNVRGVRRLRLHNELHKALERNELSLHYQAQVDIASRRIIGFEALMRWQHPELGFISPVEFIPIAEESGVIVEMGAWALNQACLQAKAWLDAGHGPLRMAVNLSARQFADDELMATVIEALEKSGLPPASLELEITESIAMQGLERTVMMLTALKKLGIALAMDDFGTGYSSLSYLKRFPLDALKVDQSFVRNITTDPGDAAITRAVVAMAHSFGMIVIAEGVETTEHLEFLAGLGCEDAQGYLFSKPLPAVDAGALLAHMKFR